MVWITTLINKPGCFGNLTIFIISFISSFEIVNVVLQDPKIFLWIVTSAADTAAVTPNSIKALLANGLSTFPIKDNPVFSDGPKSLPRNPPECRILCNWVFYYFILADELFAKALQGFETWLLGNNNLFRKLFSPTTFD